MTTTAADLDWTTPNVTAADLLAALRYHSGIADATIHRGDGHTWIKVPAPRLAHSVPEGATNVELWTFCVDSADEDAPLVLADETAGWTIAYTSAEGWSETVDGGGLIWWDDVHQSGVDVDDPQVFLRAYSEAVGTLIMAPDADNLATNATIARDYLRATFIPRPA